jgi:hypothetical protein
MSRTGKIARLLKIVRGEFDLRLADGGLSADIVK